MSGNAGSAAGGGALYGLGIFGALVYYWQQVDAFWEYVPAIVQGLFWPAWMVYEGFSALGASVKTLAPQRPRWPPTVGGAV